MAPENSVSKFCCILGDTTPDSAVFPGKQHLIMLCPKNSRPAPQLCVFQGICIPILLVPLDTTPSRSEIVPLGMKSPNSDHARETHGNDSSSRLGCDSSRISAGLTSIRCGAPASVNLGSPGHRGGSQFILITSYPELIWFQ